MMHHLPETLNIRHFSHLLLQTNKSHFMGVGLHIMVRYTLSNLCLQELRSVKPKVLRP